MQAVIDAITYAVHDVLVQGMFHLRAAGPLAWIGLCWPMLLLDLPRIAAAAISAWRERGQERRDLPAERAFLAGKPRVSVVVPAYNARSGIEATVRSLLETGYPDLQIVVVDDNSEDGMYERIRPFTERGDVLLVKNSAASGRGGKPSALNLGLVYATGEFVVFIDADSTVDHDLLVHMIGAFQDPRVGAVSGNVTVRNSDDNLLAFLQAGEYKIGIELSRTWLSRTGRVLGASGASCAFRRSALRAVGGSSSCRAEDLDNSLMLRRAGYQLVFRPKAVVRTEVPTTVRRLFRQRQRWDRDVVQVAFRKHRGLMDPRAAGWALASELWLQVLLTVVLPYACLVWLVLMAIRSPDLLLLILGVTVLFSALINALALAVTVRCSIERNWRLVATAPFLPFYSAFILAPVRLWSTTVELLRVQREDAYLPQSYWRNAELP